LNRSEYKVFYSLAQSDKRKRKKTIVHREENVV